MHAGIEAVSAQSCSSLRAGFAPACARAFVRPRGLAQVNDAPGRCRNHLSATAPVLTRSQVAGGNVLIDFTGGASDVTGNFTVLSTTNLVTPLTPIAATITTSGPGLFRATVPVGTPAAFYRIKR